MLLILKRREDGVEAIKSAVRVYAAFPDALVVLGRIALSEGDYRVARRYARKARKIEETRLGVAGIGTPK